MRCQPFVAEYPPFFENIACFETVRWIIFRGHVWVQLCPFFGRSEGETSVSGKRLRPWANAEEKRLRLHPERRTNCYSPADFGFLGLEQGVSQNLSGISATEWRQKVAHGVSRGNEGIRKTSRGAAKERDTAFFFRPIRGLAVPTLGSHGSRRGLSSYAAPQLFPRFFPMCKFWRCAR